MVAISKCPSCGNHHFECAEIQPRKSSYRLMAVQCASCAAVVGVLDWMNIGAETNVIKQMLKKIGSTIGISV